MSSLRSFLRFLLQCGRITIPLANAVPTVAARHLSRTAQIFELLKLRNPESCDKRRESWPPGLRHPPAPGSLGLACREVAHLCLEDIDWQAGELCVHGKRARLDRLPLPQDVGQAIANYLKTRQPVDTLAAFSYARALPTKVLPTAKLLEP
jgi:site-specific recombinase XerC